MKIPTLGYQDDISISKSEIALTQLTESIEQFVSENFICATTLAGASEDILRGLINQKGEKSTVEEAADNVMELREKHGLNAMEDAKKKNDLYNHWNKARNSYKHHGKKDEGVFVTNLFDDAYWMIKRALEKAKKLNIAVKNEIDFENWCIEKIHL